MTLTWYVCDLKTGVVLNTLPLSPEGDIERTVGAATTVSVQLDLKNRRCPKDWQNLLDYRRVMVVLDDDGYPLIGYRITKPVIGKATIPISLRSLESVPEKSFCRDHEFFEKTDTAPGDDEADAAAVLLSDKVGPSWGFEIAVTQTGKTADHSYTWEEDRTVASALTDLMEADGGPEWTVRLRWESPQRRRIIKTIQVAPRVGSVLSSTVIDNKYIVSRTRTPSAEGDDLAVHFIATSDGSGLDRPMSNAYVDQAALDAGIPQWETRRHVTGIDDAEQLDRVAEAGLRKRWNGITTWDVELASTKTGCPRVGRDFDAGDTITIDAAPTQYDPKAWRGPARLIGWRAKVSGSSFSSVTPVLWEDREVGDA